MKRKGFDGVECSIARAVDEVCEPWTLLILRHAFLGGRQFSHFEEFLGIPPTTLTRRLSNLVDHGLLERSLYEDHPPRYEYLLTEKALDLLPLFISLAVWGSRHQAPNGPPFDLVDAKTGRRLDPIVVDRSSGRRLEVGSVALALGSGASSDLRERVQATGKRRLLFGPARVCHSDPTNHRDSRKRAHR
jgi:DNA-binding HxlR family transcriptional regulator